MTIKKQHQSINILGLPECEM